MIGVIQFYTLTLRTRINNFDVLLNNSISKFIAITF